MYNIPLEIMKFWYHLFRRKLNLYKNERQYAFLGDTVFCVTTYSTNSCLQRRASTLKNQCFLYLVHKKIYNRNNWIIMNFWNLLILYPLQKTDPKQQQYQKQQQTSQENKTNSDVNKFLYLNPFCNLTRKIIIVKSRRQHERKTEGIF